MRNIPGVAARLFTLLANEGIEIKLVTTSEIDISYLIYEKDVDKAINAIKLNTASETSVIGRKGQTSARGMASKG